MNKYNSDKTTTGGFEVKIEPPTEYSTKLANRIRELLEIYPDSLYCTFMTDELGKWHMEEGNITYIDENNMVYLSGGDQLHEDGSRFCIGRFWYIKENELWKISNLYNHLDKHETTKPQNNYTTNKIFDNTYYKFADNAEYDTDNGEINIAGTHLKGPIFVPYIIKNNP